MKKWFCLTIVGVLFILGVSAGVTVYVDPLFHFHGPISNLEYPIQDFQQRYISDGMARNFDYDALIVGTSMTENFKPSEMDKLFDVNSLKISVTGASFQEIDIILRQAFKSNDDIKIVIRGLDLNKFHREKDEVWEFGQEYLWNDNPFDDVQYLFNKDLLLNYALKTFEYTRDGEVTLSRDAMFNWMNQGFVFGKEAIVNSYELQKDKGNKLFSEEYEKLVNDNVAQNVLETVNANPNTQFYLFFPPYSICEWELKNNDDGLDYWMDLQKCAIEQILMCDNVKLFSFDDDFDLVCNLDNYRDRGHYGEWVNSYILESMKNDEHQLTIDNYHDYIDRIMDFYTTYDYASLHN